MHTADSHEKPAIDTKTSLFNLSREASEIQREIEDGLGEITPELDARLAALGAYLPRKVDGFTVFMRGLSARAEGHRALGREAVSRARALENLEARMLSYANECLPPEGVLMGDLFKLKRVNNPASVTITEPAAVPVCYTDVELIPTDTEVDGWVYFLTRDTVDGEPVLYRRRPNKVKCKEALQSGKDVPGATLSNSTRVKVG